MSALGGGKVLSWFLAHMPWSCPLWVLVLSTSGDCHVASGPALIGQAACQSWGCLAPVPSCEPFQLPPGEDGLAQRARHPGFCPCCSMSW